MKANPPEACADSLPLNIDAGSAELESGKAKPNKRGD
jgi:hypothetical protein